MALLALPSRSAGDIPDVTQGHDLSRRDNDSSSFNLPNLFTTTTTPTNQLKNPNKPHLPNLPIPPISLSFLVDSSLSTHHTILSFTPQPHNDVVRVGCERRA